jgi:transglutaminase-like putative cysteine protease
MNKSEEESMSLHRREFLASAAALAATAALPRMAFAQAVFAPKPGEWQNYEILTHLEVANQNAPAQAWIPVPSVNEADWFKSLDNRWTTNGKARLVRDPKYGAQFVHVEWAASEKNPVIDITSRISTRDRAVDFSKPGTAAKLSTADYKLNTAATKLIPTDGIVKETSDKIVKAANAKSDLDKTRAIYEWVIDNTYREAKVRGCGTGDIAAMLRSGTLGGKCADLNALFVGLVRAQGIPARDVYGIRVAPSAFGYKSLGANSPTITKAQHCRAEVHLAGFGWVAMDPADVRKVVLEEPPANLPLNSDKVVAARKALFGSWETNWLAYNFAHDVNLPGAKEGEVAFLMYPQAETVAGRLDCLDPDTFRYAISAKRVTA